jgi:hypothetical protein
MPKPNPLKSSGFLIGILCTLACVLCLVQNAPLLALINGALAVLVLGDVLRGTL